MFWSSFLFVCSIFTITSSQLFFPEKKGEFYITQESYDVKQVLLLGFLFEMTWTSTNVSKQFNYFDSLTGEGAYYLAFDESMQSGAPIHINTAVYILFDPKYYDKKLAVISVPFNKSYNRITGNWEGQTTSKVELYDGLKLQGSKIQVPNTTFLINETYSYLSSQLFSFTTVLRQPVYQTLLPWVMLLPSLLMLGAMHFITIADINPMKISLLTLFINLIFLLFISLLQLYYGVMNINNPEGWLIFTGVITFTTAIRFVQCFQPVIRRINGIRGYLQFYALIFVYIWCLFTFGATKWFMVINSLFLLPQIIHNAYVGMKPGFYISYILTVCLSQLYIIYYKGCPENILRISPSYWVCCAILLSLTLQILLLYAQHRLGSRFFIPRMCIPGYHNYIQEIEFDLNTRLMVQDCTICLLPLCQEPGVNEEFEEGKKTQLYVQNKITKKIMRTPCNHRFHVACLETWMEQKMECPIDRSKLPPLEM